jgi:hypothetical protein
VIALLSVHETCCVNDKCKVIVRAFLDNRSPAVPALSSFMTFNIHIGLKFLRPSKFNYGFQDYEALSCGS